ncbi:MAG: ATPase [Bacteroidota bacterium]|nr:ATPase [Bacteroidota bacterium]
MIIIADSGSTKTNWIITDFNNKLDEITTVGLNPLFLKTDQIVSILKENFDILDDNTDVSAIYFYGAGCSVKSNCDIISNSLNEVFKPSEIEVNSDLLGAARALCGREEGIAGILGTGSNSCYFDGERIVDNVTSLGFIMSDEGSGSYLGKTLLRDIFKNIAPVYICQRFREEYNITKADILDAVYRQPNPNRYLATFTNFIYKNLSEGYLYELVYSAFEDYMKYQICLYNKHKELKLSCLGSVAYYFSDILKEVGERRGITLGKIIKSPINELLKYHTKF